MSLLDYKVIARDPKTGKKIKTQMQASSESGAAKLLISQGLAPIEISLLKETADNAISRYLNRIRVKEKIIFSRQMATLVNAGLPLVQSLRTTQGQTKGAPFKLVQGRIISDIEGGMSFSEALSRHQDVFGQIYISLIAAGEVSGTLDRSLERLALQQEKDAELASKVKGAMIYPLIVMIVMILVVSFMLVSVLPQVKELYDGFEGVSLPFLTLALLAVSNFIIHFWWVVIIAVVLALFVTSKWARTFGGKTVIDRAKMKMPPFNMLFMKMYMARFARTGSTLVAAGVPLIQVLEIVSKAIDNVHISASIARATELVKGGKSLADALEGDPNFLDLVPSMLKIGEQSGQTESMLAKTADYFEREVDDQVKAISTIIEPMLMVALGIVAITIVAAILVPIYSLVGKNVI